MKRRKRPFLVKLPQNLGENGDFGWKMGIFGEEKGKMMILGEMDPKMVKIT